MYGTTDGGAFIITEKENIKSPSNFRIFQYTTIKNCFGVRGAALYMDDVSNVIIGPGNFFLDNEAFDSGGAIYFSCNDHKEEAWQCSMRIEDNTTFARNSAGLEGGAIKWNFYEPLFGSVIFKNNKAGIYGDNVASVPQRLVMNHHDQRFLSGAGNETSIKDFKSGGLINF